MKEHDPSLCDYLLVEEVVTRGGLRVSAIFLAPEHPDDEQGDRIGVPESLDCEPDTGPLGFTMVGPLMEPRPPATR